MKKLNLKLLIAALGILLTFSACESGAATSAVLKGLKDGMYVQITTNRGDILLLLEHEKTPMTVANFVGLAEGEIENKAKKLGEPYYDGLKFHRVMKNFMIQGGDPQGTGSGGPGYSFLDETNKDLLHNRPGILSMANSDSGKQPWANTGKTNGSQFFITHGPTPHLDGLHTVFGHLISGQDVVNSIVKDDPMIAIKILRKGASAKAFDAAKVFAEKNK